MGVPGLWDILRPTGQVRSLTHLAVESGFVANEYGYRAYRIGIDASIWFFHAQGGREGENPELRTLFFRCCRLMAMPFLPIFVFDGPKRPKIKRGKAVGGKEHWMINSLRTVLDAFGFECRTAPGEAEAELAYLNRAGFIDAVLSDDVDCFLFGACTVIRNSSATLSGNKTHGARNADGKEDGQHVNIYRADDLLENPAVRLSKGGLILIALLRGGDYDQHGVDGCGVSTAHALARAGFGDTLLTAALSPTPGALAAFLPTWRAALRHELRTNASGLAPRKSPTLAQRIPESFPALNVLRCYTHPITSEGDGRGLDGLWRKRADVAKVAHVCEMFFEWGIEKTIVKRFRSFLWPGAVLRALLHAALEKDRHGVGSGTPSKRKSDTSNIETPSKALARTLGGMSLGEDSDDEHELATAIHGERRHASTDHMLEYRLEIRPQELVRRARAGIQGLRNDTEDSAAAGGLGSDEDEDDEGGGRKGKGKPPPDPDSKLRVWMPAVMVAYAYPGLVEDFEERQAAKQAKKATGKRGAKASHEEEEESTPAKSKPAKLKVMKDKPTKAVRAKSSKVSREEAQDDDTDDELPVHKLKPKAPAKSKTGQTKGDVQPSKRSSTTSGASASGSKSILQFLAEDDPFLASSAPAQPKSKPKAKPSPTMETQEESSPSRPKLTHRPFPVSLEDVFGGSPPIPNRTRKHSSSSESSADLDDALARLKKSPRKFAGQTSSHKALGPPPHSSREAPRAPSPSPMRPFLRANMKPLQMAMARSAASVPDNDVIVISSDSDVPAPPRPKLQKALLTAKPRGGFKKALSPTNMNLDYESDVIDLT